MSRSVRIPLIRCFGFALSVFGVVAVLEQNLFAENIPAYQSAPIPLDQVGAVVGKEYQGNGLSVTSTPDGARLRCVFQRLEGQVTSEGLWLTSTAEGAKGERFRVVAVAVGREENDWLGDPLSPSLSVNGSADWQSDVSRIGNPQRFRKSGDQPTASRRNSRLPTCATSEMFMALPCASVVQAADNLVRFIRPGLIEEYSVSIDGVRQDFIIEQRPEGEGKLRVELEVTGAKAEPLVNGVRLVLDGSGRKINYNRLRVVDAEGEELDVRLEVTDATRLVAVVDDTNAAYPVRIDPTFSDADWISMGLLPDAVNQYIYAAVTDEVGNLYVGGDFIYVGDVSAYRIAKWDGSRWAALGSGMNSAVYALAVSGSNVYVGGAFTMAGGGGANRVAKWNGIAWSALGSGMNNKISALTVSGTNLYAGGVFTTAGGVVVNRIAKWNGSVWSALGSGMSSNVSALIATETDLYAGGDFILAGAAVANRIAKWDGSAWSAFGSGMNAPVAALALLGTNLYAGGSFTNAGGVVANLIAKWDGISLSSLGSGINGAVNALAVISTNLFAGGTFNRAGDKVSAYIAKANIGAARGRFGNLVYSPTIGFSCTFLDASVDQHYRIQSSRSLAADSWTDFTNFIYNGPVVVTDPSAGATSNKFFRAVSP